LGINVPAEDSDSRFDSEENDPRPLIDPLSPSGEKVETDVREATGRRLPGQASLRGAGTRGAGTGISAGWDRRGNQHHTGCIRPFA